MVKTKKFLSLLLALAMVVCTCAISASAWTATNNEEAKLEVTADKTIVNPEDVVNVSVTFYLSETTTWAGTFGGYAISFLYNQDVLTTSENNMVTGPITSNFVKQQKCGKIVVANPLKLVRDACTTEEQAEYDANGYNAICKLQGAKDLSTSLAADPGYWTLNPGESTVLVTVQFTVNSDVQPGTTVNFQMLSGLFAKNHSYIQTIDVHNNKKGTNQYGATKYDYTNGSVALPVASTPSYTVAKSKSEAKFTRASESTVNDAFDYRLTSVVSAADLTAMNTNGNTITKLGFVAANAGTTATLAEAKAAVEAGEALPAGWKTATTTYISQANATADAYFGCRIANISHAAQSTDITCAAYVAYTDADGTTSYVWYADAVNAAVSTNYSDAVSRWLVNNPE